MSKKLKKQAKKLAKKGRYGDKHLIHVNDEELYSLMMTGKLTKNPKTGLPEAFSIGGVSWSDIRNAGEAGLGGSALGGPVGSVLGTANDIQNPGGQVDTVLRDVGGGVAAAGGALIGADAIGLPMWGAAGGAGADAGAVAGFDAADVGAFGGADAAFGDAVDFSAADPSFGGADAAFGNSVDFGDAAGTTPGTSTPWTGKDYLLATLGGTQAITGGYGLYNAYQGRQAQKKQQQQQQQYFDQLNDLMAHPERVSSLPGYQFGLQQGDQALARRMASMGYGSSGNLALATQRYGTDYATQALGIQEQLLASQYGRAQAPTETMPDPTSLAMRSLSNMGYGAAPFLT